MNWYKHFSTITKHRHQVIRHCAKAGIFWQGLRHDLSKYTPTEFFNGVRNFQGYRSPNEQERETKGFSEAWMHHKGRNRHHFEYWTDYNPKTKRVEPVPMPTRYVAEMFCDRLAASKIYNKENYTPHQPLDYFIKGKPRRIIHPETSDLLEGWLTLLDQQGEDAVFKAIKTALQEKKQ
ncbi:MAG: catalase [Clostridia bacterium]|nr:catalase [Clostridia bacterium]